jgi:hypothetical protein
MTYWRMQLHPADPENAVKHSVESLAAEYVGLDFAAEVGDLTTTDDHLLIPSSQRDYRAFAHEMQEHDHVLIICHHFPFVLVRVAGPYNYIRAAAPELGVWFRHFRKIDIRYYADYVTNAHQWARIIMTDTIAPLRDENTASYRLITEWLAAA